MANPRTVKKIATVLLKNRASYQVTIHELLTRTADDLYDGLIKPMAKYGGAGKAFSRFGIDEDTWKEVQKEIRSRSITDQEKAVDAGIIAVIQEGMRAGGCSEEDIAGVR